MIEPMLLAVLVLHAADVLTTWFALTQRKGLSEANGIIAPVMRKIGLIPALLVFKLPLGAGLIYAWPYVSVPGRWVLIAIGAGIVVNNVVQIKKARAR